MSLNINNIELAIDGYTYKTHGILYFEINCYDLDTDETIVKCKATTFPEALRSLANALEFKGFVK